MLIIVKKPVIAKTRNITRFFNYLTDIYVSIVRDSVSPLLHNFSVSMKPYKNYRATEIPLNNRSMVFGK